MTKKLKAYPFFALLTALALFGATRTADSDYEQGIKALAANDYTSAAHYLELAIAGDPDNVRFASEYRQVIIHNKEFDRSLQLFEKLAAAHPKSANVHLNFGFAYVDKIPAAGSITQVILANNALTEFTTAVELQPSWINFYTRGMSYLFWPRVFNRAPLGVDDLKHALKMQKSGPSHPYHVKTYIGLGDGYWKTDNLEKARATWREGLKAFPDNEALKLRLQQEGDQLKETIEDGFDPSKRVNTDLRELWSDSKN